MYVCVVRITHMTLWDLGPGCESGSTQPSRINNTMHCVNRLKKKRHMILSTGHSNFPSTITEAQGLGLLEILSPIQSETKQKFKQFLFGCLFVLCFNSSYKENKKTITELYRAVHLTFRFYRNESSQLSVTLTIRSVPILLRLLASEASVFIT